MSQYGSATQGFGGTAAASATQGFGGATQQSGTLSRGASAMSSSGPDHEIDEAPLGHLIGLMTSIQEQNNAEKRKVYLESFWKRYGRFFKSSRKPRFIPDFRVLRLLCPELDRERPVYNLKEAGIAKLYCEIYNLPKDHPDNIELTNWRDPTAASGGGGTRRGGGNWRDMGASVAGIFPAVLYKVMEKRSPARSVRPFSRVLRRVFRVCREFFAHARSSFGQDCTIKGLNKMLDDLYRASKTEKKDRKFTSALSFTLVISRLFLTSCVPCIHKTLRRLMDLF